MADSVFKKFEVISTNGTVIDITAFVKDFKIEPLTEINSKQFIPYRFDALIEGAYRNFISIGDFVDFVGENDEYYPYVLKEIRQDSMYVFEPRKD